MSSNIDSFTNKPLKDRIDYWKDILNCKGDDSSSIDKYLVKLNEITTDPVDPLKKKKKLQNFD